MTDTILGRQLDEYRLLDLLGKGGMARVYLGQDVRLKRHVAIKVIDRPFRTDDQYIQRFEREAQAVAQLEHSHIVRLYRYGETEELLYIAMQYIEGADLDTLLSSYQKDGTLIEPEDALRIIDQVGQALDYAHKRGVIHRDVKPSNVMLDMHGAAYLADFGLALFEETGTRGEVFGTPAYISPEQAQASNLVVPQSDIYSLGVVLFEMFTGQLPFNGEQPLEVALQHLRDEPPPPREIRPDLSPELEAVILKSLAKEVKDRYQSCAELTSALREALAAKPITNPVPVAPVHSTEHSLPARVSVLLADEPALAAVNGGALEPPPTGPLSLERAPDAVPFSQDRLPYVMGCAAVALLTMLLLAYGVSLFARGDDESQIGVPPETTTDSVAEATSTSGTATAETDTVAEATTETDTAATATMETATDAPTEPAPTVEVGASPTLQPSPVPTSEPTATATVTLPRLYLVTNKEDSLFITNMSTTPIPLQRLRFGDGDDALSGSEWERGSLGPGECVTIWKENGRPKPPNVQCREVGERLEAEGKEIFWDDDFSVYFDSQLLDTCKKRTPCVIELPLLD